MEDDPLAMAEVDAEPPSAATAFAPVTFEDVYQQHFDLVWRSVRRLGVPDSQVDDAVQDVFLAVHRRLAGFEGRAALTTWLLQFVVRVASTHRRSVRRSTAAVEKASVSLPAPPSSCPQERTEAGEGTTLLYRLLGELSDDRRAVFVLAELEELSMPDIAQALGLNLNTAYSRLRAARADFEAAVQRERAREDWRSR